MKHEEIVAGIRDLEFHPGFDLRVGICSNVSHTIGIELRAGFFESYPNFSGMREYPLKHHKFDDPKEGYLHALKRSVGLWQGAFGQERRRFLSWLADNIQPDWYISCI